MRGQGCSRGGISSWLNSGLSQGTIAALQKGWVPSFHALIPLPTEHHCLYTPDAPLSLTNTEHASQTREERRTVPFSMSCYSLVVSPCSHQAAVQQEDTAQTSREVSVCLKWPAQPLLSMVVDLLLPVSSSPVALQTPCSEPTGTAARPCWLASVTWLSVRQQQPYGKEIVDNSIVSFSPRCCAADVVQ